MNLANSTMKKKKNSFPIDDLRELLLLFCFNCCKIDNAVVLTHPVGYSGPLSAVNDISVTKIDFLKAIF